MFSKSCDGNNQQRSGCFFWERESFATMAARNSWDQATPENLYLRSFFFSCINTHRHTQCEIIHFNGNTESVAPYQ